MKVLVVQYNSGDAFALHPHLAEQGWNVVVANTVQEGIAHIPLHRPDVILFFLTPSSADNLSLLAHVAEIGLDCPVMMVAESDLLGNPIEGRRLKVADVLPKAMPPETIVEKIRGAVGREIGREGPVADHGIVGRSSALQDVLRQARVAAATGHSVLITGESGTGKELFARYVHDHSPRKGKPFVTVNCAALGETLFHSEMFGHKKGSFTGADSHHHGYLHEADGGSLFLDEIGEIPPHSQVKLLRALERGEYSPVGETRIAKADVRYISATNRDINREIGKGHFRLDLFYRLNVFSLALPPLRDRAEDIPALVDHFLKKRSAGGCGLDSVPPEMLGEMMGYAWPGNVRELENVVIRALAHSDGGRLSGKEFHLLTDATHVVTAITGADAHREASDQMERKRLLQTIVQANGDVQQAADILRVHRATLYRKFRKYDINPNDFRPQGDLF